MFLFFSPVVHFSRGTLPTKKKTRKVGTYLGDLVGGSRVPLFDYLHIDIDLNAGVPFLGYMTHFWV